MMFAMQLQGCFFVLALGRKTLIQLLHLSHRIVVMRSTAKEPRQKQ